MQTNGSEKIANAVAVYLKDGHLNTATTVGRMLADLIEYLHTC